MSKSSAVSSNNALHTPIYGLFVLAILYTLYLAHEVILPIVLALLVTLLLSPVVEGLYKRFRLPKAISALMLLLLLISGVLGIGYSMSGPLMQWVERAPSTLTELLVGESKLQQRIDQLTSTAAEIEEQIEAQLGDEVDTAQTVVLQTDSWRSQFTSGLYQTIAGVTLALALTYFLLVSGDRMLLNLTSQLSRRKRAIMLRIVRNGQQQITRYLGVITATNSAIGIAIGLYALSGKPCCYLYCDILLGLAMGANWRVYCRTTNDRDYGGYQPYSAIKQLILGISQRPTATAGAAQ